MSSELIVLARELGPAAPEILDLTDPAHLGQAQRAADRFLAVSTNTNELRLLEAALLEERDAHPLLIQLAAKLAVSRSVVLNLAQPAHVSIVFAVYQEHQRILTREQHPGGEDFLVRKVEQLDWLVAGCPDITWDMFVVDDGCPDGSGQLAEEIAARRGLGERVQVLYLAEAITEGMPVTAPLTDPSQSRKGGSIALGLWKATRNLHPGHVAVFTDADLSTHLGQVGLLLEGVLERGYDAAIGSRREPASVVIKQGARNNRGKLFIYLWKRVISILPDVVDTQCGFKGFRAETVHEVVQELLEKKFAFDIELLIKTRLHREDSIVRVPVAWIDSDVLSTTTDLQPYLPMLKAMVQMYRVYLPQNASADLFAEFIVELDDAGWERLLENIPAAITDREPADFGDFAGVSAADLRAAAE